MRRRNLLIAMLGTAGLGAAGKLLAAEQPDRFSAANEHVKELLRLMDTDKSGKISKQEWMNFMEAEFNRLDKDGSGELDPKELQHAGFSVRRSKS